MNKTSKYTEGFVIQLSLKDEEAKFYRLIKMRETAQKKLNDIIDHCSSLLETGEMDFLPKYEQNSFEMEILDEKKKILFCDILLRAYKN